MARHVEGDLGYDPNSHPLKTLLADVKSFRDKEQSLGLGGPDYVTVSSSVGAPAGPADPQHVYPIVDEFEVTVPTDGFIYDELETVH